MFRARFPLRQSLLFTYFALLSACAISAQTLNQGSQPALTPNTSIQGSDIDVVSLSNGSLHIEIPILEVVERGHKLRWAYIYDTPVFNATFFPTPTPQNLQSGYWHFVDPINRTWGDNWRLSDPFGWFLYNETIQWDDSTHSTLTCTAGAVNGVTVYDNYELLQNYQLVDPKGTVHPTGLFQYKITATDVGPPPTGTVKPCNPTAITASPAYDGTGEYVDTKAGTIRLKDGTLLAGYLDTNGNAVSSGADFFGRNPVTDLPPSFAHGIIRHPKHLT